MTVNDKIQKDDNNIEQGKTKLDLDRQTATIPKLRSGNIGIYEYLTEEDVSSEKRLLAKAANIKKLNVLT